MRDARSVQYKLLLPAIRERAECRYFSDTALIQRERPMLRRLMGPYDVLLSLILLLTWLFPIAYMGATNRPVDWLPSWLTHQHAISCLFIYEARGWSWYDLQIQTRGDGVWRTLSEKGYFEMPVFGYRTRMHRLLGDSYRRGRGAMRIQEIAQFITVRYAKLHPNGPPLDAIRFVRIFIPNELLARQTGRFKPLRQDEVPKRYLHAFGEVRFDGKRPTDGGFGRIPAAKRPRTRSKPRISTPQP